MPSEVVALRDTEVVEHRAQHRVRDRGSVEPAHEALDLGDRLDVPAHVEASSIAAGNNTLFSLWMCSCMSASSCASRPYNER